MLGSPSSQSPNSGAKPSPSSSCPLPDGQPPFWSLPGSVGHLSNRSGMPSSSLSSALPPSPSWPSQSWSMPSLAGSSAPGWMLGSPSSQSPNWGAKPSSSSSCSPPGGQPPFCGEPVSLGQRSN